MPETSRGNWWQEPPECVQLGCAPRQRDPAHRCDETREDGKTNQHDAEDAVQAVLVRVAAQPKLLAAAKCPWSYLLRMVRNEALGILRRKKRWSLVSNLTDLLTRRLVDEVELEDTHRAVWIALRQLPTEQAEVVVLKIWEEISFAEIGEVLEISQNTAASRYKYAMQKLSRQLAPIRLEACHD